MKIGIPWFKSMQHPFKKKHFYNIHWILQTQVLLPLFSYKILYINSLSLSVSVFVYRGPKTQISFNKIVPPNSRAQKLFRTSNSYFLLLLLRPFSRSNCWRSLLLTFTFTSVFAQQLPSSMGEVFLGFGGWVRRFGCAFFGLRV